MKAKILNLGSFEIEDQKIGNTRLNVYPFTHNGEYVKLPIEYVKWEKTLNDILKYVPVQEDATQHYITINSEFFTEDGTQRREGIHIDGNFCVDPNFGHETWGGISTAQNYYKFKGRPDVFKEKDDNSHVVMGWELPYDIIIPIGDYVSETKGGLFVVSSNIGTRFWCGEIKNSVYNGGSMEHMREEFVNDLEYRQIPKNQLVFMSSNTPHETLPIKAGTRRTFMRLTLNHNYDNSKIFER